MSNEMPPDPFLNADLLPMAKGAHEFYTAFRAAEFTRDEAMQLTVAMISALMEKAAKNPPGGV